MKLEGSCHCGEVRFSVESAYPYPFNLCYCSICRKTAGGGGFAINLGADFESLDVRGQEHVRVYRAGIPDGDAGNTKKSPGQRSFCGQCGSALWVWDPRWPELLHPFASAIDTPLPAVPERTHLMLASKPAWVRVDPGPTDKTFDAYPDESIVEWHARHGL
jgi:hypothetical protein